jgi:hypothetical protein
MFGFKTHYVFQSYQPLGFNVEERPCKAMKQGDEHASNWDFMINNGISR